MGIQPELIPDPV